MNTTKLGSGFSKPETAENWQKIKEEIYFNDGSAGKSEFAEMAVIIVETVNDDGFPPVVKCEMTDIYGKQHTFIEKVPVVYSDCVLPNSKFPMQGAIRGKIISQNNEKVIFNAETPDCVESIEGKTGFEVNISQIKTCNS